MVFTGFKGGYVWFHTSCLCSDKFSWRFQINFMVNFILLVILKMWSIFNQKTINTILKKFNTYKLTFKNPVFYIRTLINKFVLFGSADDPRTSFHRGWLPPLYLYDFKDMFTYLTLNTEIYLQERQIIIPINYWFTITSYII